MPRLARNAPTGLTQHVTHSAANRRNCFLDAEDYQYYLLLLNKYSARYQVRVHAWVLMSNHMHLLATPMADRGMSKMMHMIAQQYAYYFNRKYHHTGSVWGGRFKNCVFKDNDYLLYCYAYIENNPVRTGICRYPDEYRWSSCGENTNRVATDIVTPHKLYMALGQTKRDCGENYRLFLSRELETSYVDQIRQATRRGQVI